MEKPKIETITLRHIYDSDPDLSYLGEFTSQEPDPDDLKRHNAIRHDPDDWRTHDYWIPCNSVADHRHGLSKLGYSRQVAEETARAYVRQDYQRHLDICDGSVCFIGIQAQATVSYTIGNGNHARRLEHFTSSGLWGIESDSGPEYFAEIETQELDDLRGHLERFNVDTSDFADKAPMANGMVRELETF